MIELFRLEGSPGDRGNFLGQLQQELLQQATRHFTQGLRANLINELPDRARQLIASLNTLVPEWVAEARMLASTARISISTLVGANAVPLFDHERIGGLGGDGSTGFMALGEACALGNGCLHLNLDNVEQPLHLIARAASPGTLAYVSLASALDLGCQAFLNESGLAGSWQLGAYVRDYGNGLHPQFVLRALAERGVNCPQALDYFLKLHGRYGLYTPGNRGVIFQFVDAEGRGLLIEAGALKQASTLLTQGITISASGFQLPDCPGGEPLRREIVRQKQLRQFLLQKPVTASMVAAAACLIDRDKQGVCNERTAGSFTAFTGIPAGSGIGFASLGMPCFTLPQLFMPELGLPASATDGSLCHVVRDLQHRVLPLEQVANARNEALLQLDAYLEQGRDVALQVRTQTLRHCYETLLAYFDEANYILAR